MSAVLHCHQLTVTRGGLDVLVDVDWTLLPGRRFGVVGPNGVGKSTLLQALAGQLETTSTSIDGAIERVPDNATVGYLAQEPSRSGSETVDEFLARRAGVAAAQGDLDAAAIALADDAPGAADRYSQALERWMSLGAADFDARAGVVFDELALTPRLRRQTTETLSGGEAARVSLASILLARYDVLLLDEPTNDLDVVALDILERWLLGLDAAVAVVSHDRAFLERTITDVVEIDHHAGTVTKFAGGWTSFLREREVAAAQAQQRFDEYDARRQSLADRGQRQREWAARGAGRVRRSGESDKHIRHHQLNQTEQLSAKAAQTDRALERLDVVDEPRRRWELRYSIPTAARSGDVVATLDGASVRRGEFRLGPVDLAIAAGDRVAILGPNGSGKTTLIDLLVGRRKPESGRVSLGSNVLLGEIGQRRDALLGAETLIDAFVDRTGLTVVDARSLLAKFGIGAEPLQRPVVTLSPGERTRVSMAELTATGANLLVLDEPTNHLDIEAIEQLEQAVNEFSATLIVVTHDRTMLRSVRFARVVHVEGGGVTEGTLADLTP